MFHFAPKVICHFTALGIPASPAAFNDVSEKNFGWTTVNEEIVFWLALFWVIFDICMHTLMSVRQIAFLVISGNG